jgi:uncharacterized membrane protein YhaH (DUF805 family)
MKFYAVLFIIFWVLVIIFPDLIGILVGSFFIFIWINMLVLWNMFSTKQNPFGKSNSYTQWGKYKIFK